MLVLMVIAASALVGYTMSTSAVRDWVSTLVFALTVSIALYVILDYEFPRVGFIRIDPVDQVLVEDEGDDEADGERPERDQQPGTQLVEVLDERRLLAVPKAAGNPHALLLGGRVVAAGGRRDARLFGRRQLGARGLVVAGDRVLELAHPLAERPPHLRQPFRAEDEQHDEENEQQLPERYSKGHALRVAPERAGNG